MSFPSLIGSIIFAYLTALAAVISQSVWLGIMTVFYSVMIIMKIIVLRRGGLSLISRKERYTPVNNYRSLCINLIFFDVIFGISLMPAGIYNFKRLRSIYLFPAITMILLGVFFMLFSLDIVKMSFAEFFINWWPLLLLIAGVLLVGIFFVQQILKKDFPYMEDDSLEDGDENETEKKI